MLRCMSSYICGVLELLAQLIDGFVFASAHNVANGHSGNHFVSGELANDSSWLITALSLDQLVALQCADALNLSVIEGSLVELLAQPECDGCALEGRIGV